MLDRDLGDNNHQHYVNRKVNIDDKGTGTTAVRSSNVHLRNVSPILRINLDEPQISVSLGSKGNCMFNNELFNLKLRFYKR